MCAVSFEVAPRNVPIRFAGEVTFFMTSSSFSIILRASTIVSCWSKICGRSSNKSRRTGSPGGNEEITRSNESRRLSGVESPTSSSNPSLRLSLIYGLGQSAEPSLTIASSDAFAMFTHETFRSSTPPSYKTFNHRLRRKFQIAKAKHENAVRNFATRGQHAACWIWILELGVSLGFEDWNLGFPTSHRCE